MLAKNNFIHRFHGVAKISKLDLNSTIDSIFIIESLLSAIVKDCSPVSGDTAVAVSKLMQDIWLLEKKDSISDADFFYIDKNFYAILTDIHGFHRVANIILKEKLHLDRTFRLFVKGKESYTPILRAYGAILCGVQENHSKKSLHALCELSELLKQRVMTAKQSYPEFFQS